MNLIHFADILQLILGGDLPEFIGTPPLYWARLFDDGCWWRTKI